MRSDCISCCGSHSSAPCDKVRLGCCDYYNSALEMRSDCISCCGFHSSAPCDKVCLGCCDCYNSALVLKVRLSWLLWRPQLCLLWWDQGTIVLAVVTVTKLTWTGQCVWLRRPVSMCDCADRSVCLTGLVSVCDHADWSLCMTVQTGQCVWLYRLVSEWLCRLVSVCDCADWSVCDCADWSVCVSVQTGQCVWLDWSVCVCVTAQSGQCVWVCRQLVSVWLYTLVSVCVCADNQPMLVRCWCYGWPVSVWLHKRLVGVSMRLVSWVTRVCVCVCVCADNGSVSVPGWFHGWPMPDAMPWHDLWSRLHAVLFCLLRRVLQQGQWHLHLCGKSIKTSFMLLLLQPVSQNRHDLCGMSTGTNNFCVVWASFV